jgi:predicted GH43/DUF377 family glycosyl hydrolase
MQASTWQRSLRPGLCLFVLTCWAGPARSQPASIQAWLAPQEWRRDTAGPVVSLGEAGAFDDRHLFAPCVMLEDGTFWLWYCGSRGSVADRVFRLGLATSQDGRALQRHAASPVLQFADGRHSVLTPTLLTELDGTPLREQGRLRMWLSSTDFHDASGLHTLHESTSEDGVHWSPPSAAMLEHVYAPTVLKDGETYRLWYTDVSANPWCFRYAESRDGRRWAVHPEPVLQVDQSWESGRLFYPLVRKAEDLYLMWYGSYWREHPQKTALGFAVSQDGKQWTKSPHNPVLRPDESRPWESHYTTSHSVVRLTDGTWRMWYASRMRPPFVNKYFAINTAVWPGPVAAAGDQ